MLKEILLSKEFWVSVIILAQAVLFQVWPDFPKTIWTSLNGVFAVVIGILTAKGYRFKK